MGSLGIVDVLQMLICVLGQMSLAAPAGVMLICLQADVSVGVADMGSRGYLQPSAALADSG